MALRRLRLLYIEDDEEDVFFFQRVTKSLQPPIILSHAASVAEAIEFIQTREPSELPELILCDLKLPSQNGFDFVRWLRASPFSTIPVVILTSSDLPRDIKESYRLGANSYLVKPVTMEQLEETARTLVSYWRENEFDKTVSAPD